MGKAGRAACILTPMLLTLASFICLLLVELGGFSKGNDTLNGFNFFTADLTNITVSGSSELSTAIQTAKDSGTLADIYQIHLWNYCSSNSSSDGDIDYCSKRKTNFVFDPLDVWGITIANSTTATTTSTGDNAVESAINTVKDNLSEYEDELLGASGRKALEAYRKVGKWMFIAYQVSFWTTLATLAVGLLAICSRWGSVLTWIVALVSSVFTFASVLTSTVLFSVLVTALNKVLKSDYGISLSTTRSTLIVCWLAVAFSWGALFFWLFSICCCSGRSNPHHKTNKGGLWNAEPKGTGYNDFAGRGRGLQVEKTGGGYERVASPYVGGPHEDQVPLHDYAQPTGYGRPQQHQTVGLEPYRHS